MPVDTIKIDLSFIRSIGADAASAVIVRAVIGVGRSLGRRVVADGVEELERPVEAPVSGSVGLFSNRAARSGKPAHA